MTKTLSLRQVAGQQCFFMIIKRIGWLIHPLCSKYAIFASFLSSRLTYEIQHQEISAAARLITNSFASSLIVASPTGLLIGQVRQLDRMHIRSVCQQGIFVDVCSFHFQAPFGLDNPRRIVHEASLKAFGVVCTRNEPTRVGDYEPSKSSFQLIDHNSLARWFCLHHLFKYCLICSYFQICASLIAIQMKR